MPERELNAERLPRVPKPFFKGETEARSLKLPATNYLSIPEPILRIIIAPEPSQPLLNIIGMTAPAYLHHLRTIIQLASPDRKLLPAITQTKTEHISHILLQARTTFPDIEAANAAFEEFLVKHKVYEKARYYGWSRTPLLDADDIAQMVAIHLWEQWWNGSEPIMASHLKFAIREVSRNKWSWRVTNGKASYIGAIESATNTSALMGDHSDMTGQEHLDSILNAKPSSEDIRGMDGVDCRIDVEDAITTITLYMMFIESLKRGRHRTQPHLVPERLDAFFKGYMYYRNGGANGHIGGRHNSYLLGYWRSRGLHKSSGLKWRDRIFPLMAGLLVEYESLSQPKRSPKRAQILPQDTNHIPSYLEDAVE